VQLRDPNANYHRMTSAELAQLPPASTGRGFHTGRQSRHQHGQRSRIRNSSKNAVDSLLTVGAARTEGLSALARSRCRRPSLSSAFVNEDFRFGSTLSGAKEMLPRDKRVRARLISV
jgi:hypothetical protein